jgi:hypothetical protein
MQNSCKGTYAFAIDMDLLYYLIADPGDLLPELHRLR